MGGLGDGRASGQVGAGVRRWSCHTSFYGSVYTPGRPRPTPLLGSVTYNLLPRSAPAGASKLGGKGSFRERSKLSPKTVFPDRGRSGKFGHGPLPLGGGGPFVPRVSSITGCPASCRTSCPATCPTSCPSCCSTSCPQAPYEAPYETSYEASHEAPAEAPYEALRPPAGCAADVRGQGVRPRRLLLYDTPSGFVEKPDPRIRRPFRTATSWCSTSPRSAPASTRSAGRSRGAGASVGVLLVVVGPVPSGRRIVLMAAVCRRARAAFARPVSTPEVSIPWSSSIGLAAQVRCRVREVQEVCPC